VTGLLLSYKVQPKGHWTGPAEKITLTYADRFLRRKRLVSDAGTAFLADLSGTQSLSDGDAFELSDGRLVRVVAADEDLLELRSDDLVRLAWHIGNRHTPCQVGPGRLLIQPDHVLYEMVLQLGGQVTEVREPFTPEGGAYGHGRTHGHAH
jgi:urease accessory protein